MKEAPTILNLQFLEKVGFAFAKAFAAVFITFAPQLVGVASLSEAKAAFGAAIGASVYAGIKAVELYFTKPVGPVVVPPK